MPITKGTKKKYSNVKKPKNRKELRVCLQLVMAQNNVIS